VVQEVEEVASVVVHQGAVAQGVGDVAVQVWVTEVAEEEEWTEEEEVWEDKTEGLNPTEDKQEGKVERGWNH